MASGLDKFLRLDWAARLRVMEAAAVLAAVWAGLRTVGYVRTRAALERTSRRGEGGAGSPAAVEGCVSETAWAVAAAASHSLVPTMTCLHRTLALWWMLRRRGIGSEVRIGTVRTERGLEAHAWLEKDGAVLNDEADVGERFVAFEGLR